MPLIFRSLIVLALLVAPLPLAGEVISGRAGVIDGDTLVVDGRKVRLYGIDAPELDQTCGGAMGTWPCGQAARDALAGLAGRAVIDCAVQDTDRYGRAVAVCLRDQTDLGAELVRRGSAAAYRRYSDRYAPAEAAARAEGLGIWQGPMQTPEAHRRARSTAASPAESPAENAANCRIKGNIGASGRRIYHLPGQADYDATRIDPRKGEAWFCSEAEARAAGFRPAKR